MSNVKFSTRAIEGISSCAVHLANGRVVLLTPREPSPLPTQQDNKRLASSAELRTSSRNITLC